MNDSVTVDLHVNGVVCSVDVPVDEPLVLTLRDRLGLRSVRPTCGIGVCGTCTVQLDGAVVSSCLLLTRQVGDRQVRTSEGLVSAGGDLHSVQQAFVDAGAYQCGYCIPAMVVTVEACLRENPGASLEQVREYLAGNLCRCGTYVNIIDAVRSLVGAGQPVIPPSDSDEG